MMKQTVKEFFTSKVNWAGMLAGAVLTSLLLQGFMTWTEYVQALSPFLVGMGLRDTIFGQKV